jgi:tRNA(fMet)-specific endonuclease VapC
MTYLIDTNIILQMIRERPEIKQKVADLDLFHPSNRNIISIVSEGEIRSIALQNQWHTAKLRKLDQLLSRFAIIPIQKQDIIARYAEIDAFSQGRNPMLKSNFSARNMGKNDLWIAATASVLSAKLLTTDVDFLHLENVFLKLETVES